MDDPLVASHSAEAMNAEIVATEAREKAINVKMESMLSESEKRMTSAVADALRQVFGENTDSGRFIDISRIPLICQSIVSIRDDIKEIKEGMVTKQEFVPVRYLVYGAALLILTAFLGALIIQAIPHGAVNLL